jgi:hypothetical protein
MGKEYSDFLMLQKECTLHQIRTMTATSTTIPPALKGMPAPLGNTLKDIQFTENTDPDQDEICQGFYNKKVENSVVRKKMP